MVDRGVQVVQLRLLHRGGQGDEQGRVHRAHRRDVLERLESPELDGFWLHLDADVLDPTVMPAVDSPDPDGLTVAELTAIVTALARSPRCVGLHLTIYDPDLDPEGTGAALLADLLTAAIGPGPGPSTAAASPASAQA